jgi:hypothetical protein
MMAVNKPVGDNARKGAVKKRTRLKNRLARRGDGLDQAQQDIRGIHGGKKSRQRRKRPPKVQGRPAGAVISAGQQQDDPRPGPADLEPALHYSNFPAGDDSAKSPPADAAIGEKRPQHVVNTDTKRAIQT